MSDTSWRMDQFSTPAAPNSTSSQSSLEDHLRSGAANRAFLLLAPHVQDQLIARLQGMDSASQSDTFQRMGAMGLDDLLQLAGASEPGAGSTPAPAAVAPSSAQSQYRVRRGDSLSKIAQAQGITLKSVINANPQIANPDLIHPDQVINLPT